MANGNKGKVGFARPPQDGQFKKGTSGNPNGRPKGSKNTRKVIADVLDERVPVTANGKRKSMSKRQAMATQLVNKAASGDLSAISRVIVAVEAYENGENAGGEEALSPEDSATLRVLDRIIPAEFWEDNDA